MTLFNLNYPIKNNQPNYTIKFRYIFLKFDLIILSSIKKNDKLNLYIIIYFLVICAATHFLFPINQYFIEKKRKIVRWAKNLFMFRCIENALIMPHALQITINHCFFFFFFWGSFIYIFQEFKIKYCLLQNSLYHIYLSKFKKLTNLSGLLTFF